MKVLFTTFITLALLTLLLSNCGDTSTATIQNSPPVFQMGFTDTTAEIGSTLYLALQANDADNDKITFAGLKLPAGAIVNSSTGLFKWNPDTTKIGKKDTVIFTASDNLVSDTCEVIINVKKIILGHSRLLVPQDYKTIQTAIDAARHGDTVVVRPGTYSENITYKSKAIVVASEFIITKDTATINATIIRRQYDTSRTAVVEMSKCPDSLAPLALVGFTIRNGITKYGGGVNVSSCSPEIAHCVIDSNTATGST